MAVYKVIQDIEAEDKLLGPLTLRQFIYAIIVVVALLAAYKLAMVQPMLAVPLLPIIIFFGALAAPLGGAQSSEVWLLAKIRFFLLPRRKIWNQDGIQHLVAITAPKVVQKVLTKDLTRDEVESRLQALANTIDSRGWAIKNVDTTMYAQPIFGADNSQRLMQVGTVPQDPGYDATSNDDILDEQNNPRARQLDQLIQQNAQAKRQELVELMHHPDNQVSTPVETTSTTSQVQTPIQTSTQPEYWFLDPATTQQQAVPPVVVAQTPATTTPMPPKAPTVATQDEQALLNKIHDKQNVPRGTEHLHTIQPLGIEPATPQNPTINTEPPVTTKPDPVILEFAHNDDLSVATIQRQANKRSAEDVSHDGEVVISLH